MSGLGSADSDDEPAGPEAVAFAIPGTSGKCKTVGEFKSAAGEKQTSEDVHIYEPVILNLLQLTIRVTGIPFLSIGFSTDFGKNGMDCSDTLQVFTKQVFSCTEWYNRRSQRVVLDVFL